MGSVSANGSSDKTPKAAIYVRVSTQQQSDDGTSLATQEERCQQYAAEHGYTVDPGHVYVEVFTGTELWDRPQLSKLREAIRSRQIGVLIAYAIDRLSRDPVHLGVILSEAEYAGVRVEFVTEPLDDSPEGQLIRFVRGYAAKVEHEKIRERVLRGRRRRAENGALLPGSKPRYGYRWADEKKTRLEINDDEAAIVRRIFTEYVSGKTLRHITADLIHDGIPSPKGLAAGWHHSTVRHILGEMMYTGRASAWRWQGNWHPRDGEIRLPAGTAPPLIDEMTYQAAQARLQLNQQFAARNNHDPTATLLRGGFVVCGHCGRTMQVRWARSGPTPFPQYWCAALQDGVWRCPEHPSINAQMLDRSAWQHISAILEDPTLIRRKLDEMLGQDLTSEDLAAVDRRLLDLARRQQNLVANLSLVTGHTAVLVAQQLQQLEDQQRDLQHEREAILKRRAEWEAARSQLADLESWCERVRANLATIDYRTKRLALEALSVKVRVWRPPHVPRWEVTLSLPEPSVAFTTKDGTD